MAMTDMDISSYYPRSMPATPLQTFKKVDEALVDGIMYHTVVTLHSGEVASWLRDNGGIEVSAGWALKSFFDVPDDVYTLLVLRYA
jgi:hypothetical protein